MFHNILVPIDFSKKNEGAIEAAREVAAVQQASITLLHVIQELEVEDEGISSFYESLEQKSWEQMSRFAAPLEGFDPPVEQQVLLGNRSTAILQYVLENEIDLVILSSHQVDLDNPAKSWATLSYQVAVVCPCPVLLVK